MNAGKAINYLYCFRCTPNHFSKMVHLNFRGISMILHLYMHTVEIKLDMMHWTLSWITVDGFKHLSFAYAMKNM